MSEVSIPDVAPPSQTGIGPYTLGMPLDAAQKLAAGHLEESGMDGQGASYKMYSSGDGRQFVTLTAAKFRPGYLYGMKLTGEPDPALPNLNGVHLGDTAYDLMRHLGVPDSKEPLPRNFTRWNYENRNYSFEVSSGGDVISMQVYGYAGLMLAQGWRGDWESYVPNSIAAVIDAERPHWEGSAGYLAGNGIPIRPRVIYTAETSVTPPATLELIRSYLQSAAKDVTPEMYQRSVKVLEDGQEYWLPVQYALLKDMQKNLKSGDPVDLFVVWLGAANGGATKVAVVNNYCSCSWSASSN